MMITKRNRRTGTADRVIGGCRLKYLDVVLRRASIGLDFWAKPVQTIRHER